MQVLHVIPTLAPAYGGPSHAVIGMVRGLGLCGVDVTVATTHGPNEVPPVEVGTARVMSFPRRTSRLIPASFAYAPGLADWLEQSVRHFGLVHVHTLFNFPFARACSIARRRNVPYVIRPCGMLDPWSLRQSRLKKRLWFALGGRRNLNGAMALHFTSADERELTESLRLIPPGAVFPLGVDLVDCDRLKPRPDPKVILFLSRLHPKKGLDVLIPALGDLAKTRNDFIFVLAGSGEATHQQEIERLLELHGIRGRTELAGFVHGDEKDALLRRADIFVLPSYQENFGLAVAEAMAARLPVVVSDRVNIHSDVTRYHAGFVTPPVRQTVGIAIRLLLDDVALRQEMGGNGCRMVREKFYWPAIGEQMAAWYQNVLALKKVLTEGRSISEPAATASSPG